MKKLYILPLLILTILFIFPLQATSAMLDGRCWTEEECVSARVGAFDMPEKEALEGFYDKPDAVALCGTYMEGTKAKSRGFCLPVGKTVTKISFGGKTTFNDMGEFIQDMYKYGLQLAGVLAVLMIIIAGFQWTVSGGNASTIESAKKRIGGAIVGLMIAILSYTILNTINPRTINLRLPEIWMVNPSSLSANYCSDLEKPTTFALFKKDSEKKTDGEKSSIFDAAASRFGFDLDITKTECGSVFFPKEASGRTCLGTACNPNKVCVYPDTTYSKANQRRCISATIAGNIEGVANIIGSKGDLAAGTDTVDRLQLMAMCDNGTVHMVKGTVPVESTKNGVMVYTIPKGVNLNACTGNGTLIGFYLGLEVNDDRDLIAINASLNIAESDDWHAFGKNNKDGHECSTNLAALGFKIAYDKTPACSDLNRAVAECSCATLSIKKTIQLLKEEDEFKDRLITKKELEEGFHCDIKIARSVFPRLDNHSFGWFDNTWNDMSDCREHQ